MSTLTVVGATLAVVGATLDGLDDGEPEPFYIDLPADGLDQTLVLETMLAAAPPGKVRLPDGPGIVLLRAGFTCSRRTDLEIEGNPAHPFVFESFGKGLDIHASTDVVVRYVEAHGPNTYRDAQGYPDYAARLKVHTENEHGLAIRAGSVRCGIEHCVAFDFFGDGAYIGYQNDGLGANVDCWMDPVVTSHCGRNALSVTNANGLRIRGTFDWARKAGLDVEPNNKYDRAWNLDIVASIGSHDPPVSIGGADNGRELDGTVVVQRHNIDVDITVLRHFNAGGQNGFAANRGPSTGTLRIRYVTPFRVTRFGMVVTGGWPRVEIHDSDMHPAATADETVAVVLGLAGADSTALLEGNDFAGWDLIYDQVDGTSGTVTVS